MSRDPKIQQFEERQVKKDVPVFSIGDTLSVQTRIVDEKGKERLQVFTGIVIAQKGKGISETVSLYRVAHGGGVEKTIYLHSPNIAKIEVMKKGKVRRSKLYYLRGKSGKAAKVKGYYAGQEKAKAPKAVAEEKEEAVVNAAE